MDGNTRIWFPHRAALRARHPHLGQRHMPVEAFQERKPAAQHQTLLRVLFASTDSWWPLFLFLFCLGLNCVLSAALGVQTNGAPGTLIRLRLLAKLIASKTISLRADRRTSSLEVVVRITMEQQLLKSNLEHLSFTLEIREGATGGEGLRYLWRSHVSPASCKLKGDTTMPLDPAMPQRGPEGTWTQGDFCRVAPVRGLGREGRSPCLDQPRVTCSPC
ncbi:hypothetical protein HDV57DRAFT_328583 [Trichoderma longibrachiatum]